MDVGAAFVADCQATELVEPGEAALDDPAVAAELLGAFDAASGDPWHDVSAPAGITAAAVIVGFVGVQLVGPFLGRPGLPPMAGIASISASNGTLSWTLAPVSRTASGIPCRSVARWRFVPGRPRSVGFGPVASPPFLPRWMIHRRRPGSSRSDPRPAIGAATPGAADPRRRRPASHAIAAST